MPESVSCGRQGAAKDCSGIPWNRADTFMSGMTGISSNTADPHRENPRNAGFPISNPAGVFPRAWSWQDQRVKLKTIF